MDFFSKLQNNLRSRLKIALAISAAIAAVFIGTFYYFLSGLPSLESIEEYHPNVVTKVYSNDGRIIGEFFIERRIVVPLKKMPKHLLDAFLAAEDTKFFEHEGISYTSIFRAMYKNLLAGKVVQGGSTITQQVAKSFFLTPERTFSRKIREFILAARIEKNLTKEEILSLYLNQIYFGNGAYGIQTAAESYFGKDVEDLDISESALLAGLPKAPSRYSPFANLDLSKKRQAYVLSRMVEEKFITQEQADKALKGELKLVPKRTESLWVGPYFTEHVRKYLEEKYGEDALYKSGLEVYTTLDVEMQKAANDAVRDGLRDYDKRRGYRGAANTLKTKEDIEAFKAATDKRLLYEPLEEGKVYQGIVSSVNTRAKSLNVDVGSRRGVILYPDLEWALLHNPSGEPDGGEMTDFKKLFKTGDVIDVVVKELPSKPSAPVPLRLEQEPVAQASLLAMEPETGAIRAMVGGSDFARTQFNRTTQAMRQPGSSFKPIIYAAAIDKDYTPASIVIDSPIVFEEGVKEEQWRPRNYDERFSGPTTVREALSKSRNVITIKILNDIGVDRAISYAQSLGIKSPLARDLSLALGSSAVTLMEMTTAFSTFANMGSRPEPMFITRILDRGGNVLEENKPFTTPVLSPQTAYIMTSLMQSVVETGTARRARALGRPAAGKTGTTNNLNDAWFLGYVPGLAAGSWIGYDNEMALGKSETGGRAALPIWLKFMQKALAEKPVRNFQIPEGLEFARIDPETGLLAGAGAENAVFEVFKTGTAPTEVSAGSIKTQDADFFMIDTDSRPVRPQRPVEEEEEEPLD